MADSLNKKWKVCSRKRDITSLDEKRSEAMYVSHLESLLNVYIFSANIYLYNAVKRVSQDFDGWLSTLHFEKHVRM